MRLDASRQIKSPAEVCVVILASGLKGIGWWTITKFAFRSIASRVVTGVNVKQVWVLVTASSGQPSSNPVLSQDSLSSSGAMDCIQFEMSAILIMPGF